jgi:lipid-binding SYLF domain-containing protein
MKKYNLITVAIFAIMIFILPRTIKAQSADEKQKILSESVKAKQGFLASDPSMNTFFTKSYGYAIFPKMGKGGLIIGGSGGNGAVYEKEAAIGTAKMAQVTIGAQVGGQSYREIIFFETKEALQRFKDNKVEFSSQLSAIAVKSGASKDAKYADGVAVFTEGIGGLMAEASVGGQKFTYKPL